MQSPSYSLKTEIAAGLTTFFTMSYIVVLNPAILATQGTGMSFSGVLTATVLLCFLMTLLMGVYAKIPFAVAPGMGINAFFTYSLILGQKIPWETALGMVFWSGVLFCLISFTPIRVSIAKAIPLHLRQASAAGIGLFLTFIGLKNLGLVVSDPVTFVKMGNLDKTTLVSGMGMLLSLYLLKKKNPFSFIAGIMLVTGIAFFVGWIAIPTTFVSQPDFSSVFLKLDIWGSLKLAYLPAILSLMFTDLFDSISTFMGVSQASGLMENGEPKKLKQGLIVDAIATLTAGLFGTSSGTAYIESSAGVEVGGRTGMTSVVTALCFLPCFFLSPLAQMVPAYATAPVLILVGALMFRSVKELELESLENLIPAFLTLVLIPLTFSITQGLLWGFISHVGLYLVCGRSKEISPVLCVLSLISVALLCLEHGKF